MNDLQHTFGTMWGVRARVWGSIICVSAIGAALWLSRSDADLSWKGLVHRPLLTKADLAAALKSSGPAESLPNELEMPIRGANRKVLVQYALDARLQDQMEQVFRSYHPDYGAFVAIDARTGRILSLVSYSEGRKLPDHLALRASFPSASVFKVVTAAAAISEKSFRSGTVISFDGRNHTLYRKNVMHTATNRWTRTMTLKEAFARSVNTVFGKIGAFSLGGPTLSKYAERFGFNRPIPADVPIQQGRAMVSTDDPWELAETASGYTLQNTMSPLQGALIAATIANDGTMMEPYVVESVHDLDGKRLYSAEPRVAGHAVDAATAREIRDLMRETVQKGTSHRSFRGFFRGGLAHLDAGGKTGSLTGFDPPGKYDWFVGYAGDGKDRIAVAALTVHGKFWRVKSSYLARYAFEKLFKTGVTDETRLVQSGARRESR